jgi:hypothetical protein
MAGPVPSRSAGVPDRSRPYRVPGLAVIAPFSFVVSGLIIYWSGTSNVVKLDLAVLFFLVLYFIARRLDPAQARSTSRLECGPCPGS